MLSVTYWKPSSKAKLRVNLQLRRQSEALVPGPVSMKYWEKVTSIKVLVSSIWTSADPAGHPDPRRETPTTLTLLGGVLAALRDRAESVAGAAKATEARAAAIVKAFMLTRCECSKALEDADESGCSLTRQCFEGLLYFVSCQRLLRLLRLLCPKTLARRYGSLDSTLTEIGSDTEFHR